MPGPLFHVGAVAMCPHGGMIQTSSSDVRVKVMGMPVVTMADVSVVANCALSASSPPTPCLKVQWIPAGRLKIMGQPVVLVVPPGMCLGSPTPGPAVIVSVQSQVIGT